MPVSDDKILFDALRKAGAPEDMAYTAVQEVRNMAGQNVTAELGARIAELGTKTDSKFAGADAKIDSLRAEIMARLDAERRIVWALFLLIAGAVLADLFRG